MLGQRPGDVLASLEQLQRLQAADRALDERRRLKSGMHACNVRSQTAHQRR
jgi:hypothetical protein